MWSIPNIGHLLLNNYVTITHQIVNTDNSNAASFKIDEAKIIKNGISIWDQIRILKNAIASGRPVFFGMDPFPTSLFNSFERTFGDLVQMSLKIIAI